MPAYIELSNITKTYRPRKQAPVMALQNVSLTIEEGEFIAITGVSGSGKSTLLHILGFLDRPDSGEQFFEKPIAKKQSDREMGSIRNKKVGFVLQDFALIPYRTVYENIMIPMVFAGVPARKQKEIILRIAEKLHIEELVKRRVSQMSGGQKQRVAIARALVNDPPLILADEPTGALDCKTKREILDIFMALHQEGKTIVIVTHDPEVAEMADRTIHIVDGMVENT